VCIHANTLLKNVAITIL